MRLSSRPTWAWMPQRLPRPSRPTTLPVDSGVDREIGGFPTAKLEAPFLAVPVVPCEIITYGGVARTEQGEVIRADGEVMPGLFVGGEASCNSAYMGFTLSNCFTWGRIGAQSAAAYLKA